MDEPPVPWHEVAREMNGQSLIDVGYHEVVELLERSQEPPNVLAKELVH